MCKNKFEINYELYDEVKSYEKTSKYFEGVCKVSDPLWVRMRTITLSLSLWETVGDDDDDEDISELIYANK